MVKNAEPWACSLQPVSVYFCQLWAHCIVLSVMGLPLQWVSVRLVSCEHGVRFWDTWTWSLQPVSVQFASCEHNEAAELHGPNFGRMWESCFPVLSTVIKCRVLCTLSLQCVSVQFSSCENNDRVLSTVHEFTACGYHWFYLSQVARVTILFSTFFRKQVHLVWSFLYYGPRAESILLIQLVVGAV